MFGRSKLNSLEPPALASDKSAREVLRMWVRPEWSRMQVALSTNHPDPAVWGIALVDIARHVAKAYELAGTVPENEALRRIKQLIDAEWTAPTDMPEGRLRE